MANQSTDRPSPMKSTTPHPRWCQGDVDGAHYRLVGAGRFLQVEMRQEPGKEPTVSVVAPDGPSEFDLIGLTPEQAFSLAIMIDKKTITDLIGNLLDVSWDLIHAPRNPDRDPKHLRRVGAIPLERPGLLRRAVKAVASR